MSAINIRESIALHPIIASVNNKGRFSRVATRLFNSVSQLPLFPSCFNLDNEPETLMFTRDKILAELALFSLVNNRISNDTVGWDINSIEQMKINADKFFSTDIDQNKIHLESMINAAILLGKAVLVTSNEELFQSNSFIELVEEQLMRVQGTATRYELLDEGTGLPTPISDYLEKLLK